MEKRKVARNPSSCCNAIRPDSGRATVITCTAIRGRNSAMAGETYFPEGLRLPAAKVPRAGANGATRYQGWLFVASGGEKEIAVADLASFRRVATIPLPCAADQLFQSRGQCIRHLPGCAGDRRDRCGTVPLRGQNRDCLVSRSRSGCFPMPIPRLFWWTSRARCSESDLANRRVTARLPLAGSPADLDLNDPWPRSRFLPGTLVLRVVCPSS